MKVKQAILNQFKNESQGERVLKNLNNYCPSGIAETFGLEIGLGVKSFDTCETELNCEECKELFYEMEVKDELPEVPK